jgi:hypothetical protein
VTLPCCDLENEPDAIGQPWLRMNSINRRRLPGAAQPALIGFLVVPAALMRVETRQTWARWRLLRGGTEGNARLTASTGVVLLVLLVVEGVTILAIRPLLSLHVFIGLMLIPPVVLKLSVTGYRFVRYYLHADEYVRKGPPMLLMIMLVAPVLVAATIAVFATGVALVVVGPQGGIVLGLHKVSFVVWGVAFALHVLVYALRVPRLVAADWVRSRRRSGAALRTGILALALIAGLTLALVVLPAASPWLHRAGGDH